MGNCSVNSSKKKNKSNMKKKRSNIIDFEKTTEDFGVHTRRQHNELIIDVRSPLMSPLQYTFGGTYNNNSYFGSQIQDILDQNEYEMREIIQDQKNSQLLDHNKHDQAY